MYHLVNNLEDYSYLCTDKELQNYAASRDDILYGGSSSLNLAAAINWCCHRLYNPINSNYQKTIAFQPLT